ncbi:MAG TPA: DapH/DapD/GlmU-related protein [Anaerolineales bacterium]
MQSHEAVEPQVHVRKSRYLLRVLASDPFELLRVLGTALTTAKFRYLRRCIGKGTVVGPHTEIVNAAQVHIGRDCLLQDGVYIRAGTQGKVVMGDRVALNSFCRLFGHGSIEIGDDAQLGPGSLVTTTEHDVYGNLEASFKKVVIGKRAWIGANVTILPGVKIGEYAVIGAGSVVTKDIPARCIAVGVPARVIKTLDEGSLEIAP